MPKLVFDKPGDHFFETGVDHCVLFVKSSTGEGYEAGVAWNGITTITESPEGAEESAIYADNIKYLSLRSVENFNATVEAYTYPDEFEVCDGSASISAGVKIGQQARRAFALCYRTKKGSDANPDLGFIYHIIYGASAAPAERAHETVNDSPAAMTMSWSLTTVPVEVEGFKPTAHVEIDSTKFTGEKATKLQAVLDKLYGSETEVSGLLLPDAIVDLLK